MSPSKFLFEKFSIVTTISCLLSLTIFILSGCTTQDAGPAQQPSLGLSSDTTHSADHKPIYDITFKRGRVFGSTVENLIGIRGWGSVIADHQNRVFIPDYQSNAIHVFDHTGEYITQMGGEGRGPGEYLHMSDIQITPDYLYIYGRTLFKITAYSLKDLSYSHTIPLNKKTKKSVKALKKRVVGGDFFVTHNGKILMGFDYLTQLNPERVESGAYMKNHTVQWYWLNQQGVVNSDMIVEQKRKRRFVIDGWGPKGSIRSFDFFGEPLIAMTKDGTIVAAQSKEFKISLYNSEGRLKHFIEFPFVKTALVRKKLVDYYKSGNTFENTIKALERMDLPDTWPALNEMFFDDQNRMWVSAIVPDFEVYEWFIFNIDGQLLARFTWPRKKTIHHVNNNFMYTTEVNENGIREIVRYEISMDKI